MSSFEYRQEKVVSVKLELCSSEVKRGEAEGRGKAIS